MFVCTYENGRVFFLVDFHNKDRAKSIGAFWDRDQKLWYKDLGKLLTEYGDLNGIIRALNTAGFEFSPDAYEIVEKFILDKVNEEELLEKKKRDFTAIQPEGMAVELYPFQKAGVAFLEHLKTAILADDMGLGKTVQSIGWARNRLPVLVVCPASLKENWKREILRARPNSNVGIIKQRNIFYYSNDSLKISSVDESGSFIPRPDWLVVNYDMLGEWLAWLVEQQFKAMIADECFPKGTLVKTSLGMKPIETLKIGDQIANAIGYGEILAISKKKTKSILKIKTTKQTFFCTPDHPILTNEGWKIACELNATHYIKTHEETLRILSEEIYRDNSEKILRDILFSEMENVSTGNQEECLHKTKRFENIKRTKKVLCRESSESNKFFIENETEKSNAFERSKIKNDQHSKEDWTQAKNSRWQWSWTNKSRASFTKFIKKYSMELYNFIERKNAWLSAFLQGGFSYARNKASNRSGWIQSLFIRKKITGQEKRIEVERVRVVSIESLKQESFERYGFNCDGVEVYNLQVSGHPSYVISELGLVVHNCHYIKNPKSNRTIHSLLLSETIENRLCVTGTPLLNRPTELFTLLQFIGKVKKNDFYWWRKRYCELEEKTIPVFEELTDEEKALANSGENIKRQFKREENGKVVTRKSVKVVGAKNSKELRSEMMPYYLRRLKSEVLTDLPEKTFTNHFIELTNRKEYDEAEADIITYIGQTQGWEKASIAERAKFLAKLSRLRQLSVAGKMSAVKGLLDEVREMDGKKAVIFSNFVEVLQKLKRELKSEAVIYVGDDAEQSAIDQFQTNLDVRFFLTTIKKGGVGITLTQSDTVIFIDLPWTPGEKAQAEDRCHRIGQKNNVTVIHVIGEDTVDGLVLEALATKDSIIKKIVDGKDDEQIIAEGNTIKMVERMMRSKFKIS